MGDNGTPIEREQEQEQVASAEAAAPSRVLFEFTSFNGFLKSFQVQNMSADQLMYLAKWLDWYSERAKDRAEIERAQAAAQILRPGQPGPGPNDPRFRG